MLKKISDEQIKIESEAGFKPLTIESGITLLPFSELGDREFELLSYLLVKEEIDESKLSNITSISLMQGVSERGRDCVFYNHGNVSGLIQCKKYAARLSRPQSIKEMLKFILFSTLDNTLLPDPDNFEYKLYVSNDFTEPTLSLINSYSKEIDKEIDDGNIDKYIEEVVNDYESFSCYKDNLPLGNVKALLKKIKLTSSNATDLSSRVYRYDNLLSMFFNVKTVVDLESADSLIRNALDDYGLKYLTDSDLKKLQERIGNTKEENRINLGFVDFFGYNKEFFRFLKGESFKGVMESVMEVKSSLDRHLLDFVSSKINELVLLRVTEGLLFKGKIHTFSVGVASPYLLKRLTMTLLANTMPEEMLPKYYPQFSMTKEELVSDISNILFDSSERVMAKDYSQLVGNPDDIAFKIRIFEHMHNGLNNIDDAKLVFEKDIKVIQPVLDEIEKKVNNLLQAERTIVIKDSSFFDDKEQLKAFADTIKSIG
jgi:hypothetical protein